MEEIKTNPPILVHNQMMLAKLKKKLTSVLNMSDTFSPRADYRSKEDDYRRDQRDDSHCGEDPKSSLLTDM